MTSTPQRVGWFRATGIGGWRQGLCGGVLGVVCPPRRRHHSSVAGGPWGRAKQAWDSDSLAGQRSPLWREPASAKGHQRLQVGLFIMRQAPNIKANILKVLGNLRSSQVSSPGKCCPTVSVRQQNLLKLFGIIHPFISLTKILHTYLIHIKYL